MSYDVEVLKGGNVLIRADDDKIAEDIANKIRSVLDSNNDERNTKEVEPNIGVVDEYGWIYAGRSVEDHQKLWISPNETEQKLNWYEANDYAAFLQKRFKDAGRNCNVSLPTITEFNNFFRYQRQGALSDTFNEINGYWSSSKNDNNSRSAWVQRFTDGPQGTNSKKYVSRLVRCVRRDLEI
jgi:hypothetical protein